MKKSYCLMLAALPLLATLSGCRKKEMFSPEEYQHLVDLTFPVADVDKSHDWLLAMERSVRVECQVDGVTRVQVLTKDPTRETQAEVVAEQRAQKGQSLVMTALVPKVQQQLCVVATDDSDRLLALKTIGIDDPVALLANSDAPPSGYTYNMTLRQRVYYLYEASFPTTGDWDYNDIVLTIDSPEPMVPTDPANAELAARQMVLHVTLQAVGYPWQLAAAIRLAGISRTQVESVTSTSYKGLGLQRNVDYPPSLLPEEGMLLTSRQGEAVMALFDDAHLAVYSQRQDNGMPYRYYYNVEHKDNDTYKEFPAPEADYVITFSSEQDARLFTLARIDPFIITDYNGGKWEIHKYPMRVQQTLYEYVSENQENFKTGYTWCMEVPYAWFRYPTEGRPMGRSSEDQISGAYTTWSHSYVEWALNSKASLDWYLYPNTKMVY